MSQHEPKTTFLDDEDYRFLDELCDHEDAELDILTGCETCGCGWSRWLSSEEYKSRVEFEAKAYDEFCSEAEKYERERVIAEICLPTCNGEILDADIPF